MTISTNIEYISSFTLPSIFDNEKQKSIITNWEYGHSQDHLNFFGLLNGLQNALSLPLFELNSYNLWFNQEDSNSVQNFLYYNNAQHQEFYQWLNSLGQQLAQFEKPTVSFVAVLNPMVRMLKINTQAFNEYFFHERTVHNNMINQINNLYQDFEVAA